MDLSTSLRRLRSVETEENEEAQLIGHPSTMAVDGEIPFRQTTFNEAFNPPHGIISPSPASTENPVKSSKKSKVLVDYKANDFRGFIFVVHSSYGLLLLQCTRKKNKPLHWQLPGGHIDGPEFEEAGRQSSDRKTQLLIAGKIGAARELFEETGIDVRSKLERLNPASLRTEPKVKHGVEILQNEYNQRLFYLLSVTDNDFATKGEKALGTDGRHLKLKLSVEHSGFIFQPEPPEAAEMLKLHSGGKVSKALLMAMDGAPDDEEEPTANPVVEPDVLTPRRRAKRAKEGDEPVDLLPLPVKKSPFCCFGI